VAGVLNAPVIAYWNIGKDQAAGRPDLASTAQIGSMGSEVARRAARPVRSP
jgi:hypothetical protein